MNVAYLLTGGNIGNRLQQLSDAKDAIAENCGVISNASAVYETEAWGLKDQEKFLNQALELQTNLDAEKLLQCILNVEQTLGRKRQMKYGPRTIDIDILLFNNDIIRTDNLIVPHPELPNRRFALECLAQIAAGVIHPVLHKSIGQLLTECTDPLKVYKF
jgi:2-amino-4-hydroxy-6-hydroxymethyldihydropteridine diphosphokinase